jgi:3',5'-cyclic-AMP phosphodiesterase
VKLGRAFAVGALLLFACVRPGEQRAEKDLEIGRASQGGVTVRVSGGLAAVRALATDRASLWSSAPGWDLELSSDVARGFTVELRNVMRSAELVVLDPPGLQLTPLGADITTEKRYGLALPAGVTRLRLAAPDADRDGDFSFALMSDVQEAIGSVRDLFLRMNQEQDLEFLLGCGDLTEQGSVEELERYQEELRVLELPYYTTLGNHELGADPPAYQDYFGRASFHFRHRGVAFSLLDSGSAMLDPLVHEWVDEWLEAARSDVHIVGMHIPPLDPVGVRNGAFASRSEAAALLARFAEAGVDLTLYGHIHSYYSFDNAGIPAFISGGGGALPERFDNMGRHFMVIDVDARRGVSGTRIVRVDTPY